MAGKVISTESDGVSWLALQLNWQHCLHMAIQRDNSVGIERTIAFSIGRGTAHRHVDLSILHRQDIWSDMRNTNGTDGNMSKVDRSWSRLCSLHRRTADTVLRMTRAAPMRGMQSTRCLYVFSSTIRESKGLVLDSNFLSPIVVLRTTQSKEYRFTPILTRFRMSIPGRITFREYCTVTIAAGPMLTSTSLVEKHVQDDGDDASK